MSTGETVVEVVAGPVAVRGQFQLLTLPLDVNQMRSRAHGPSGLAVFRAGVEPEGAGYVAVCLEVGAAGVG